MRWVVFVVALMIAGVGVVAGVRQFLVREGLWSGGWDAGPELTAVVRAIESAVASGDERFALPLEGEDQMLVSGPYVLDEVRLGEITRLPQADIAAARLACDMNENYHLFLIRRDRVVRHAVLDGRFMWNESNVVFTAGQRVRVFRVDRAWRPVILGRDSQ